MKRIVAAGLAALAAAGGLGSATAADIPDESWWSYCNIEVGAGSGRSSYFSRLFQGRIHNTLEDTRPFQTSPMADYDVRQRLTRTFTARGHLTHPTSSRCWSMPRRDYLETTMRPDAFDRHNDGRPIHEFTLDPLTGAVSGVQPMSSPRQRKAATPAAPTKPSGGGALIVTDSETPADRTERIAREDRSEALRVAEIKRQDTLAQDRVRRLAEEKSAMEAWKRRPKAPTCGGSTGRGCPTSRQ